MKKEKLAAVMDNSFIAGYEVAKRESAQVPECASCGQHWPIDATTCPNCGVVSEATSNTCHRAAVGIYPPSRSKWARKGADAIMIKPTVGGKYLFRGVQDHDNDYPSPVTKWTRVNLFLNPNTGKMLAAWAESDNPFDADILYGEWKQAANQ